MLALVLLAARLGRPRAFAAAFVGWNPLLAVHFAGGGHNDALMMVLVLSALAWSAAGRTNAAGAAWAAAIAIKWVPSIFLVLRAVEARATGRPVRHLGFALVAGRARRPCVLALRPRLARVRSCRWHETSSKQAVYAFRTDSRA